MTQLSGSILKFLKKNAVMFIALVGAVVTGVIVPPDMNYFGYFDYKTLTCLFCTLQVICALKNIDFFYILSYTIVLKFKNLRASILALVYITFIGSMLIANDMALITFLPLGYFVLKYTHNEKYMAFTFVMQNISANLGGMLTPFGNPQNLYLYSKYNIGNAEFVKIMFLPFVISVFLITMCCLFVKKEKMDIYGEKKILNRKRTVVYLILFFLAIAVVFRKVPYIWGLFIITVALIFLDRDALKKVDYPLLLTFVFFFVFAGNMSRIGAVKDLFSFLLKKSTLLFSVLSCQIISNVPSAILLSQFTSDYPHLLVGVNIGGTGTLIASLASLITFREYIKHNPKKTLYYIGMFSAFNFAFLIILTSVMLWF